MGLFDLPTIDWTCKSPECKGECSSDGHPDPTCHQCGGEMEVKEASN